MNPLVKEFARQALKHPDTDNDGLIVFDNDELKKFAELIVKECVNAIINDSRLNDVRSAANGCVRTINEHFGVK